MENNNDDRFSAWLESVLTEDADDVNETNHSRRESSPKADDNEIDHNQNELSPRDDVNETDHNQNQSSTMWRGNTKRKQQCAKGRSRKKLCTTLHNREPSQQPKPRTEDFRKIIEAKSVRGGLKVVCDALNRRKMIDKLAYFEAIMLSNQMQWSMSPEVKDIEIKIDEIKSDYKNAAAKGSGITPAEQAEFRQRLFKVREDLGKLKKHERMYSTKEKNLEAVFVNNEGFSDEALRKELSSALPPGTVLEETATKGPAAPVKDQGSSGTREQFRATFSNLKDELYAMDNDKVDVSDFQGLEEASEKMGKVPDHLELIAHGIEKARGEATEFSPKSIQVLVCTAIHEMVNVPIEKWNWDMLKKWGATLNKASKLGFRVEFAEKLLKNSLFAYLGHSNVG